MLSHSLDVAVSWGGKFSVAFLWHLEGDSELIAEASEFFILRCSAEGLEVHCTAIQSLVGGPDADFAGGLDEFDSWNC